jgi:hypothetical protein
MRVSEFEKLLSRLEREYTIQAQSTAVPEDGQGDSVVAYFVVLGVCCLLYRFCDYGYYTFFTGHSR